MCLAVISGEKGRMMHAPSSGNFRYVVGNWKMHGLHVQAEKLATEVAEGLPVPASSGGPRVKTVICPPFTQLDTVSEVLKKRGLPASCLALGAQDCSSMPSGPYTGEISAPMLADLNVKYVILGHSERRIHEHESSELVRAKVQAVQACGLIPIVCVGEQIVDRHAGRTTSVMAQQIETSLTRDYRGLVAYEPVWAIGSGVTPTRKELEHKAGLIHALLSLKSTRDDYRIPLLYGGSVKPGKETQDIFSIEGIDGVLVGGASLQAKAFLKICRQAADFSAIRDKS